MMIYLDNAATSYPKPAGVSDRMKEYLDQIGAPVNRSVYAQAQEVGLVELQLRERLAGIFHFTESPTQVLLTSGATAALNQAICGFLHPGDHCLVSSMEHNAVMRPLQRLTQQGIAFDRIPCFPDGSLRLDAIEPMIRSNTRLLVLSHASNVCGTVQDALAVGNICKRHSLPWVLDAAQTAGHYPVDFTAFHLSALAVPGHKGLLGPAGIGALLVTKDFADQLEPLLAGGTGSASDSEWLPPYLPDRFESGTPNLPGIYGWERALQYLEDTGIAAIQRHEETLTSRFLTQLQEIPGVTVYGKTTVTGRVGVVSIQISGQDPATAAERLEVEFGILTRCGLHCAPAAHRTLGTFPEGTIRFSFGPWTTPEEVDAAAAAVQSIAASPLSDI